jgi:hypothetical protein
MLDVYLNIRWSILVGEILCWMSGWGRGKSLCDYVLNWQWYCCATLVAFSVLVLPHRWLGVRHGFYFSLVFSVVWLGAVALRLGGFSNDLP